MKQIEKHPASEKLLQQITEAAINALALGGPDKIGDEAPMEAGVLLIAKAWGLPQESQQASLELIERERQLLRSGSSEDALPNSELLKPYDGKMITELLWGLFETTVKLEDAQDRVAMHTDDARLGRFYAANGFIPEVEGMPDKAFELLDFKRLGRRIRQAEGGIFTQGGYVVPDGAWQPAQSPEPRAAPELPAGIFRLKLRLGEEQAKLTLPAGQELVEVRERMESIGLSACAVASFHSRVPQIPAEWVTPERLEALNCLAQRLAALAEQESLALTKYKAVLEASPISSLEEAIALTERLDAYNLDRKPATPEDVAREELSCVMMEEDVTLIERYLNIYGYGEALIQQYEGELTNYGLLTRADGRPVQEPLPSRPGLNSMGMRCP